MGLTDALLRAGAGRPHVLVVAALGGTAARLAVEAELARRAWPIATSPADTDILVVAGEPGTELAAVLARIWAQIPAPRARVDVPQPETVPACLDTAKGRLADRVFQGRTALVGSASAGSASIDEGTHGQEQHSTGQDPTASAEPGANGHDHGAAGGGDLAEDDA
ncbi:hypothetical protein I4I78_32240, partial [Pseudonocardia sp. KRD-291]|nr:hypothetical protein [Pseudonocardia sp. KRD291]